MTNITHNLDHQVDTLISYSLIKYFNSYGFTRNIRWSYHPIQRIILMQQDIHL